MDDTVIRYRPAAERFELMLFGLYLNNKSNGFYTAVIEALAELMNGYIEVNRGANMETDGTKSTVLIEKFKGY